MDLSDIVGFAAGYQAFVCDHLFIDPSRSSVSQIGPVGRKPSTQAGEFVREGLRGTTRADSHAITIAVDSSIFIRHSPLLHRLDAENGQSEHLSRTSLPLQEVYEAGMSGVLRSDWGRRR